MHSRHVCRWHQTGGYSLCAQGQGCHSEWPWETGGTGIQKPYKIQGQMQSPAPGKEEHLAPWYRLATGWLGSSSAERELGVSMDNKLNASQLCALTARVANSVLSCTNRNVASRRRKVISSLYSILVRSYLQHSVQFWASPYSKDVDKLDWVQHRATKMARVLEPCEK